MKIAILTHGSLTWASARFRAFWLAEADPEHFTAYSSGDRLDGLEEHDVIVILKRIGEVDIQRALHLKALGKIIVYDMCDPDWWFNIEGSSAMMQVASAITTSSAGLKQAVLDFEPGRPVAHIPDRMLPGYHSTVAEHGERERVVLCWFGAGQNRLPSLSGVLPVLQYLSQQYPLELRVIDDLPHVPLGSSLHEESIVRYVPWTVETFHAQMTACDIALLPPYPGSWGALKSSNKQASAWWAGLPVTDGFDAEYLAELIEDAELRQHFGRELRQEAEKNYDIHTSVAEWLVLAERLTSGDLSIQMPEVSKLEAVVSPDGSSA